MFKTAATHILPLAGLVAPVFLLGACAVGPNYQKPGLADVGGPAAWHATLPHAGRVPELAQWWAQFDDPVLADFILVAQQGNPTLEQAQARVRQAAAALDVSAASGFPSLSSSASITRSNGTGISTAGASTVQTYATGGLSTSWDLDIFGGNQRSREAARARLAASQADWHDSRVVLAAEVANTYVARRQCEALLVQSDIDLASRMETHKLTSNKVRSGFSAPSDALRTEASVAEGSSAQRNQQGQCARLLNQLAALTGVPHAALQTRLSQANAAIPLPAAAIVEGIPAAVLSQRPDVASAERLLAAASADIGVAAANRLPSLSLAGSIGVNHLRAAGATTRYNTWSFGPSLSLPIFDGGSGAALVRSSQARYDEVLAAYRQKIRQAVQEVEDALVRVDIAVQRERSAEVAEAQYQKYFDAKQAQFRLGATSLLDLEDARRVTVASRQSLAAVRLERAQSWIALYKAVGGGWQPRPSASASSNSPSQ
ncbi:MAG: efflux transporter outer membrane subunit [Pseudomonadota bacterium]